MTEAKPVPTPNRWNLTTTMITGAGASGGEANATTPEAITTERAVTFAAELFLENDVLRWLLAEARWWAEEVLEEQWVRFPWESR